MHAPADKNSLSPANFALAESPFGRNADFSHAILPGQPSQLGQQFFELDFELRRRHQQFRIKDNEEEAEIGDVLIPHPGACKQTQSLHGEPEAVTLVSAERKNPAFQQVAGLPRRISLAVNADDFRKVLLQKSLHQNLAGHDRGRPHVEHKRIGFSGQDKGQRIGPERLLPRARRHDGGRAARRIDRAETRAPDLFEMVCRATAEPGVIESDKRDTGRARLLDRQLHSAQEGDVPHIVATIEQQRDGRFFEPTHRRTRALEFRPLGHHQDSRQACKFVAAHCRIDQLCRNFLRFFCVITQCGQCPFAQRLCFLHIHAHVIRAVGIQLLLAQTCFLTICGAARCHRRVSGKSPRLQARRLDCEGPRINCLHTPFGT